MAKAGLTGTSAVVSNLESGKTYYWKVVARGSGCKKQQEGGDPPPDVPRG